MSKALVIVFVKNIKLGKVKTRLAKTIGNQGAFEVYSKLVEVTEKATEDLSVDRRIYFSDAIVKTAWKNDYKAVQHGIDLGERMKNAFKKGFEDGYNRIALIGSDLPDIKTSHINNGLNALKQNEVVFGPAEDGGYYLIGLSKMHNFVFENKPWSRSNLLEKTLSELKENSVTFTTLDTLNDIDTYEDLIASNFYQSNIALQEKIRQLHD
ncbi:MAG: TIGR04282 family arsenosugar biosynthesis glycosyltransferase [Algibacter sp.]|uniref:TIGR04282 family arsenosugar biosynthesis glycosyltransferase n=1 Tax=Algibacter sp. TaxID=1872428 RepID=UPI00260EF3EF|nr:TIGR04282 family arsenosugar biosynthesis glycosyltransferase [Algibacter sp.]MDG1730154.1 TIGR04282 family arsenosugar biosynthesis glycosyltransferase [Algibacter sp.]MDG2179451.1 TIGR04282 family arsenosugar biosynthesis glycosyltransferase [Algibacter sp.]